MQEQALERVLVLFSMAPENYAALQGVTMVASFVNMLDVLSPSLQDSVLKVPNSLRLKK